MIPPSILSIATEVPSYCYSQDEIAEQYSLLLGHDERRARAVRSIFARAGVEQRYTAIEKSYYNQIRTTQTRNDAYMEAAVPLGERAVQRALDAAEIAPDEVDDLIIVSCTGFNVPGLDLLLAGRMGMRPNLRRTCVLGMGCYGAFPGLLRACEAAAARDGRVAVMLALELCSLHMQLDETSETAVSTSLFADGAGAAVVGRRDSADWLRWPRLVNSATHCEYNTLEHMSFNLTDYGFRMHLSSYVPDLLAANVEGFVDRLLADNGLTRTDIRFWCVHPGSKKIVEYIQQRLGFADEQAQYSLDVLRDYGNMSSATILFVLERAQRSGNPQPGDYGVLLAFGPGLTMESILVQW